MIGGLGDRGTEGPRGRRGVRRGGFTLIEVLVALVVASLVVLLAHPTYGEVADLSGRIAERRLAHDRAMNARRLLAAAFGSLDVGIAQNAGFDGREARVTFTAWRPDAAGAWRRVRVQVLLVAPVDADSARLVAVVTPIVPHGAAAGDTLVLGTSATGLAFDYLLDFGADAAWVRQWLSPASAPVGVRLRIEGVGGAVDTLLFVIGERG